MDKLPIIAAWLLMVGDEINHQPIVSISESPQVGCMVKIRTSGATYLFAPNRLVMVTKMCRAIQHDPVS